MLDDVMLDILEKYDNRFTIRDELSLLVTEPKLWEESTTLEILKYRTSRYLESYRQDEVHRFISKIIIPELRKMVTEEHQQEGLRVYLYEIRTNQSRMFKTLDNPEKLRERTPMRFYYNFQDERIQYSRKVIEEAMRRAEDYDIMTFGLPLPSIPWSMYYFSFGVNLYSNKK